MIFSKQEANSINGSDVIWNQTEHFCSFIYIIIIIYIYIYMYLNEGSYSWKQLQSGRVQLKLKHSSIEINSDRHLNEYNVVAIALKLLRSYAGCSCIIIVVSINLSNVVIHIGEMHVI